jgi:hypothetical protein
MEDQLSVFTSPSDRMAVITPGTRFITFYDSQGYGRDILTCLQTRILFIYFL